MSGRSSPRSKCCVRVHTTDGSVAKKVLLRCLWGKDARPRLGQAPQRWLRGALTPRHFKEGRPFSRARELSCTPAEQVSVLGRCVQF